MKIDKRTGVIDFGNGLVVDPREPLSEFDRKVPRELIDSVDKVRTATIYWFRNMYISDLGMELDVDVFFKPGEVLKYVSIQKSSTPEELENDSLWYVETYRKRQEEYKEILVKLLGEPNNSYGSYTFDWGVAGAGLDTRTPSSELKIRYWLDND